MLIYVRQNSTKKHYNIVKEKVVHLKKVNLMQQVIN